MRRVWGKSAYTHTRLMSTIPNCKHRRFSPFHATSLRKDSPTISQFPSYLPFPTPRRFRGSIFLSALASPALDTRLPFSLLPPFCGRLVTFLYDRILRSCDDEQGGGLSAFLFFSFFFECGLDWSPAHGGVCCMGGCVGASSSYTLAGAEFTGDHVEC